MGHSVCAAFGFNRSEVSEVVKNVGFSQHVQLPYGGRLTSCIRPHGSVRIVVWYAFCVHDLALRRGGQTVQQAFSDRRRGLFLTNH